jgi:acyl-CoA synthetase (AMP-forming)/AMP-acid ligase II
MRIYSGPKFKGPDVDYLSWLLARRKYKDDTKIYIDTQDLSNAITYKELVDLTKRIGRGLREYEGIGAEGRGKDVVMVYSANQVANSFPKAWLIDSSCIPCPLQVPSARVAFTLPVERL